MKNVLMYKAGEIGSTGAGIKTKRLAKINNGRDFIGRAINAFLNNETGRFDKYLAVPNALVYRTIVTNDKGEMNTAQNIIAVRLTSGQVVGNSSALPLIGRNVSFGRESLNSDVTEVQLRLSTLIQMIPFTVFIEAGLDLNKYNLIDRGNEETVTRLVDNPKYKVKYDKNYNEVKQDVPEQIDETVHFTGASLFEVDGKMFLFDIDRNEIKHKIFNAFLAEIPVQVKTIKDAYQSLKPKLVLDAESQGLEVLRQGEWFFIPVQGEFDPKKAGRERSDGERFEPLTLRAGRNRPNTAEKYARLDDKTHVVTGKIEHSGREHKTLVLKSWFKPVPNTATQSFTITGDVD